jgi:serine/threonine protein kinase
LKHVSLPEKTVAAGGRSYEIIRVVEGWTLEQVMQANPETGVFGRLLEDWANQLLELLAPLHREGFVHRDVSPFNVMLTSKDMRLVLIDFSSAAHISESGGSTIYCPGFTAPEAPRSLAPAADVYSLAALLYYVNTCKLPPSREDVIYRERRMQLAGPVYHRIGTLVENATALNPADRPASAEMALRAIRRQKTTSILVSREAGTLHLPDGRVISQHEHYWDVSGR